MLMIRLQKNGRVHDPFYRVVLTPKRSKNTGKVNEVLGVWYPTKKQLKIDKTLYEKWIKLGAKPSPAVKALIKN